VYSEIPSEYTTGEVDAVAGGSMGPAVTEMPTGPPDSDAPMGPAVKAEPWTTTTRTALQGLSTTIPQVPPPTPRAPLPTVSRLAGDAPTDPTSRSGSHRTTAVGPSIPLQRIAAGPTPSADARSSPLVVSRQVSASVASSEARSSGGMPFAAMFGSASNSESPVESGFTSVQLQSAGEYASPVSEPAADTTSAPSSSSAPPATPETSSADLDEMARRLYEPLTARLRAELWLDRERAGVTSDV
jgi:hypothetical protein